MASAAAKAPLKISKVIVRERKIVFWTPVMIWPGGFTKVHKKETVEYRSDGCLHNDKMPYVAIRLPGGVIIDLATKEVETQVSQLVEISELVPDQELKTFLGVKLAAIKQ